MATAKRSRRRAAFWVALLATASVSGANGIIPTDPLAQRLMAAAAGQTGALRTDTELADVIGPRLTWSPSFDRADSWVADRLVALGLNVHREAIEEKGLGWQKGLVWLHMVAPDSMMLFAEPAPWSESSQGEQSARAVLFDPHSVADLARYHGLLRGKALLYGAARPPAANVTPFVELAQNSRAVDEALAPLRFYYAHRSKRLGHFRDDALLADAIAAFLIREQPRVVISEGGSRPDGGESGIIAGDEPPLPARGKSWQRRYRFPIPILYTVPEQYNRAARLVATGVPVRLQWRIDTVTLGERAAFNLIGEMPGSDPIRKAQIVVIGAHLDSWTAATGAGDNGAGVAALLEAARLLKEIGYRPKCTIRFVFYAGEEEGLLGSESYADAHLGQIPRVDTPEQRAVPVNSWRLHSGPLVPGPEWNDTSAVINVDNGSGTVRGLFSGGSNPTFASELQGWIAPLAPLGVQRVFDEADWPADQWVYQDLGLPVISFLQDPLDYDTRTHHTSLDTPDHLSGPDLEQVSVTLAYLIAELGEQSDLAPRPVRTPH
jgi:carboxypeptidase Q